jgi:hypothetical protein
MGARAANLCSMLISEYGQERVELAQTLVELSDPDSAWSEAMGQGLEDVAEIIEELYFGN